MTNPHDRPPLGPPRVVIASTEVHQNTAIQNASGKNLSNSYPKAMKMKKQPDIRRHLWPGLSLTNLHLLGEPLVGFDWGPSNKWLDLDHF